MAIGLLYLDQDALEYYRPVVRVMHRGLDFAALHLCGAEDSDPAVDAGDNSLVAIDPSTGLPFTTDQTGASRIFAGGTVDMGAVEHQGTPFLSTIVNTATDDVTGNALTSLREAIGFALS